MRSPLCWSVTTTASIAWVPARYHDVIALAQGARGDDPFGYRNEFIGLVRLTQSVSPLNQ